MAYPSRSRRSADFSKRILRPGSAASSPIYPAPRRPISTPRSGDWGSASSRSRAPPLQWIVEPDLRLEGKMEQRETNKAKRRDFLKLVGIGSVAAGAAAVTGGGKAPAAEP